MIKHLNHLKTGLVQYFDPRCINIGSSFCCLCLRWFKVLLLCLRWFKVLLLCWQKMLFFVRRAVELDEAGALVELEQVLQKQQKS